MAMKKTTLNLTQPRSHGKGWSNSVPKRTFFKRQKGQGEGKRKGERLYQKRQKALAQRVQKAAFRLSQYPAHPSSLLTLVCRPYVLAQYPNRLEIQSAANCTVYGRLYLISIKMVSAFFL